MGATTYDDDRYGSVKSAAGFSTNQNAAGATVQAAWCPPANVTLLNVGCVVKVAGTATGANANMRIKVIGPNGTASIGAVTLGTNAVLAILRAGTAIARSMGTGDVISLENVASDALGTQDFFFEYEQRYE